MNPRPPEPLIIGRDYRASQAVTIAIHNRKAREFQAARRKAKCCRFAKKMIDTLRFWK